MVSINMKEHKLYSEYDLYYQFNIVIATILSFFVVVLNMFAIFYLGIKKHRLLHKSHEQARRTTFRISMYSRIYSSAYKPDEVIVLSLCVSDLFVGIAASVKLMAFITESKHPWFDVVIRYVVTFSMFVSLIHILLLSLERLLSVSSPFCHQDLRNKQTIYILSMVWLMSILPPILNQNPSFSLLISVLMIKSYIILIVTYLYIFQVMALAFKNNTNSTISNYEDCQRQQKHRERRSTFSCCSIVVSYILCTIFPVIKLSTSKKGMNTLENICLSF